MLYIFNKLIYTTFDRAYRFYEYSGDDANLLENAVESTSASSPGTGYYTASSSLEVDEEATESSYTAYTDASEISGNPEALGVDAAPSSSAPSGHSSSPPSGAWQWNVRYQSALDAKDDSALAALVESFLATASTYGRMIVSEQHLAPSSKQIQPTALGGVAGGEKFIVHGVLFKYSVDVEVAPGRWLYGEKQRRDDLALKSAGHELLGLARLLDAQELDGGAGPVRLRHALVALMDFEGVRLTAISLLPISKTSLVYGSADGGAHVAQDAAVHALLCRLATRLRLRPHQVGSVEMALCGDLEVHVGSDGAHYVLDTARVFPPAAPEPQGSRASIFYRLLRPELLAQHASTPLSADCFTQWQSKDPLHHQYNRDATALTLRLASHVLPDLAQSLAEDVERVLETLVAPSRAAAYVSVHVDAYERYSEPLVRELHRCGLGVRHLGALRALLLVRSRQRALERHVLHIMCARAVKNVWRARLSARSRAVSARDATVALLGAVLSGADDLWRAELPAALLDMFGAKALLDDASSLHARVDVRFVLVRFAQLCGVVLAPAFYAALARAALEHGERGVCHVPVTRLDVLELRATLKHLPQLDLHRARHYLHQASGHVDEGALRYVSAAVEHLQRAHHAHPTQIHWRAELARALLRQFKLSPAVLLAQPHLLATLHDSLLHSEESSGAEEGGGGVDATEAQRCLDAATVAVWRWSDDEVARHGLPFLARSLLKSAWTPRAQRALLGVHSALTLALVAQMRRWVLPASRLHVCASLLWLLSLGAVDGSGALSAALCFARAEWAHDESTRTAQLAALLLHAPTHAAADFANALTRAHAPVLDAPQRLRLSALLRSLAGLLQRTHVDTVRALGVSTRQLARAALALSVPPASHWASLGTCLRSWSAWATEEAGSWWFHLHAYLRVDGSQAFRVLVETAVVALAQCDGDDASAAQLQRASAESGLLLDALLAFPALLHATLSSREHCDLLRSLVDTWLGAVVRHVSAVESRGEEEGETRWGEAFLQALLSTLQMALFAAPSALVDVVHARLLDTLVLRRPLHARALTRILLATSWRSPRAPPREALVRLQAQLKKSSSQARYDALPLPVELPGEGMRTAYAVSERRARLLLQDDAADLASSAAVPFDSDAQRVQAVLALVHEQRVALAHRILEQQPLAPDALAALLAERHALWRRLRCEANSADEALVHALLDQAQRSEPSALPSVVEAALSAAQSDALVHVVLRHAAAAAHVSTEERMEALMLRLVSEGAAAALRVLVAWSPLLSALVLRASWLQSALGRCVSLSPLLPLLDALASSQSSSPSSAALSVVAAVVAPVALTQRWHGLLHALLTRGLLSAKSEVTHTLLGESRAAPLLCHSIIAEDHVHSAAAHVSNAPPSLLSLLLDTLTPADLASLEGAAAPHRMPLHVAAHTGRLGALRALIARGASVHARDHVGRTPLHFAVMQASAEAVLALADAGADLDAEDKMGITPLFTAIEVGQADALGALLERGAPLRPVKQRPPPLHLAAQLAHGDTALHIASAAGQVRAVSALLALSADRSVRNAKALSCADVAKTPALRALLSDDSAPTRALTASVAGEGLTAQRLDDGKGALHVLGGEGECGALRALLEAATPDERRALLDMRDKHGRLPLHFATKALTVALLVDAGAAVDARDTSGASALSQAVMNGLVDVARALLDRGAIAEPAHLLAAAYQKSSALVSLLLPRVIAAAPLLTVRDGQQQSALHLAASAGDVALARLLLESLASPTERAELVAAVDKQQQTALHKAARRGYAEMAQWLLEQGADMRAQDARALTAAQHAQQSGFAALAAALTPTGV